MVCSAYSWSSDSDIGCRSFGIGGCCYYSSYKSMMNSNCSVDSSVAVGCNIIIILIMLEAIPSRRGFRILR